MFASSANIQVYEGFSTQSGRSLIYIRNIIGPNTEPCKTPEITFWGLDILLSILTL